MIFLLLLLVLDCSEAETDSRKAFLKLGWDGGFDVVDASQREYEEYEQIGVFEDWVVRGEYTNSVNTTGWAFLDVYTNPRHPDKQQAFGAGFLEGYLTSELLHMYYLNTMVGRCDGKQALCNKITKWLDESLRWMEEKVKYHSERKSYWYQVSLFLTQLAGVVEGYSVATRGQNKTITMSDILIMNVFGDLEDLESALGDVNQLPNKVLGKGHCSAMIRLLPNNSDLLVSHDTWNSYQSMLRLIKRYDLPYKVSAKSSKTVPGRTMAFSGYPGVIYSGDDFTITSSGLTILETTIGNSNPELWKKLKPQSVLEGIRSTVANRLATDGRSWSGLFSRHNSGTYNNQWMVVDYNKFNPGQALQEDLLWVLEQIPGYTQAQDVTKVVDRQGFWPSYNSPYFPEVFNMSGDFILMEKYGDWFSYENTPRAKIFRRDAVNVVDIPSMIRLMRYNNYTQDPLSACDCTPAYSAENAISARCDLNPRNGTYPFPALGHRSHGGTDMKLTSHSLAQTLQMVVQGGPAFDPLPPFRWSEQDFAAATPHVGQPDLWQFEPILVTWKN